MPPPAATPIGIVYGPHIVKDEYHYYEWMEDTARKPVPLRVALWNKVVLKGRGKKEATERIVCQLRRKGGKCAPQVMVLVTTVRRKQPTLTPRPLQDIVSVAADAATQVEIDQTKMLMQQAAAAAAAAVEKKADPPQRGSKRARRDKKEEKKKKDSSSDDDDEEERKNSKKKKSIPKTKNISKGSKGISTSAGLLAGAHATPPRSTPATTDEQSDTPRTARLMRMIESMNEAAEHRHNQMNESYNQISQQVAALQSAMAYSQQYHHVPSTTMMPQPFIAQRSIQDIGSIPSPPRVRTAIHNIPHHNQYVPPASQLSHHYPRSSHLSSDRCLDLVDELLLNHRIALRQQHQYY
jgi:hypothetical protein